MVFWSPPRISFFRLFLFVRCPGVLPVRLEISLDRLFWVQTKNHAVAVFTLYRTSTHLKKWLLSLPRYEFTFVFYSKRARCISHSSRSFMRARADVFFFFLSRVNLQPTWVLIPLREWQKSIAFLVTTAKTEDAKLTFKIISSRHNRPPNSRSSRLFPANSRTAPSPRYALSERFESFFCTTRKAATTRREGERT